MDLINLYLDYSILIKQGYRILDKHYNALRNGSFHKRIMVQNKYKYHAEFTSEMQSLTAKNFTNRMITIKPSCAYCQNFFIGPFLVELWDFFSLEETYVFVKKHPLVCCLKQFPSIVSE